MRLFVAFAVLFISSLPAGAQYRGAQPMPAQGEDCPQGRAIRQKQGYYPPTMTDCQVLDADTAVENQKLRRKLAAPTPVKPPPKAASVATPVAPPAATIVHASPEKPVAAIPAQDPSKNDFTSTGLFTTDGMPVCDSPDHLREFLLAAVQHDERWIRELKQDCPSVIGGAKVTIIEDLPSESDIAHVVRIRVFGLKAGSATGYTLNIALTNSPPAASR
jgi:hypothetical protein